MKKAIILLLACALLLTALTACGKKTVETVTEPGTAQDAAPDLPAANDQPIETNLTDYEIACSAPKDPDALNMDAKDVYPASGKYADSDTIRALLIRVRQVEKDKELFRILASVGVYKDLGPEVNSETAFDAELIARRGDTWLFAVRTHPEEEKSFFLYNTGTRGFAFLGIGVCDLLGGAILVSAPDYADGEAVTPYSIYDWTAKTLQSGSETSHRRIGDALYLIVDGVDANGEPERKLLRIRADSPEKTDDAIGVGSFRLYFDGADGGLILFAEDGKRLDCTIDELPKLVGDNLKATGKVRETNGTGYYAVTLPDSWAGKYEVEKDGSSMSFRHKKTGSLLFDLSIEGMPEDIREYMRGDGAYPLCLSAGENTPANVMLYDPGETGDDAELRQLRMALYASTLYRLEDNVASARNGFEVRPFDYAEKLSGDYAGRGSVSGHDYSFTIYGGCRSDLDARLTDLTTGDAYYGTYRMFWNQGMEYGDPYGALGGTYLFDRQDGTLRLELDDDMIVLKPADSALLPQQDGEKAEPSGMIETTCGVTETSYGNYVFDCTDDAPGRTERLLMISASPNGISMEFGFYVRLLTVLEPSEETYPGGTSLSYSAETVARRGDTWLVRVQTDPDEVSSWLLCYQRQGSHEVDGAYLLGRYGLCDWSDDTITLYNRDHSGGETPVRKDVFEWSGALTYSTP